VVQDGSSEDLYHRPRTRFVAEFVGRVNLVPAQVVDVEDGAIVLALLDQRLRLPRDGTALRPGDAAYLVLRPEALEIVRADDSRAVLQGVVAGRTFLGEKVEYRVHCGDTVLQVVRQNSGPRDLVPPGMSIGLAMAAECAAVLPQYDT
jgi:iron(III) transport system ATP-binding protein